ncbi:MAG: GTPase RsgA [Candidatus Thiothrix putei]|uniref:GTPase RsgA n=1 Tax=Candidatus Thiothrix putei TaxID=3080811 RepID=A0AA95HEP7_9GAMM|nr:MAG: GTPase RsgA [Candidatus Thiothrix putei]
MTFRNEEFSLNRLERYLALAAEAGIDAVVVLTKKDLCADTAVYVDALRKPYPRLPVEVINATDAQDVAALAMWCSSGQTVALLGSSGVGKSTLLIACKGMTGRQPRLFGKRTVRVGTPPLPAACTFAGRRHPAGYAGNA